MRITKRDVLFCLLDPGIPGSDRGRAGETFKGGSGVVLHFLPILNCSPGVTAAAYADHEQGKQEEKGCHSEAHAVDSTVAKQRATVDVALCDDGGLRPLTYPGQLWRQM